MRVVVGNGSCGIAAGAQNVFEALSMAARGNFSVGITGCIGMCFLEPIVDVYDGAALVCRLKKVSTDDVVRITKAVEAKNVAALDDLIVRDDEESFLNRQTRVVLRNCGLIDPGSIQDYFGTGGYNALKKAVLMNPDDIISEIKLSGLAGRGGAGFPTWFKWDAARKAQGEKKYLICNADEGDPGAFMDRAIIEGDPHLLIEGMLIAAFTIGASEAFAYVRAEYPLAIKRLSEAIKQAREAGYIGKDIAGSGFSCDIKIKAGAGAFVCGEETALIESLEGRRGMPRLRPPFPAERGYRELPTNINNVETFANIPWILNNGATAFAALGTSEKGGTKVFSLTGKIERGGLVEVPIGLSLEEVIFDIGGGIRDGGKFKAVQLGGPSGGCLPSELLSTAIDYKPLADAGAIMGSGGMVIADESVCIVEMSRFFLDFTMKESCGKCVPCRIGTKRMLEVLNRMAEGHGADGDIELLEELSHAVKEGSLCGLGQTAPNPVLSTIRYFRDEYEAHIKEKRCPSKQCTALLRYSIDPALCTGCVLCAKKCPEKAIEGVPKKTYVIETAKCNRCGICKDVCKFNAVITE